VRQIEFQSSIAAAAAASASTLMEPSHAPAPQRISKEAALEVRVRDRDGVLALGVGGWNEKGGLKTWQRVCARETAPGTARWSNARRAAESAAAQ
jgi:hypothetical protein